MTMISLFRKWCARRHWSVWRGLATLAEAEGSE
ncbi:hypothetical protein HNQ07_002612 [Deinococcus metalli]|uniref:Uncharacterized protein n=1 Tax=Deinococcus metalli TaxID=1141878 RepID=A0A7W8KFA9_9DEIO|nr:hypothetical protein [Deinococcus metalli]